MKPKSLIGLALTNVMVVAAQAIAQEIPGAKVADSRPPWQVIAYAVAGFIGICILGFRDSRRTSSQRRPFRR